MEKDQIIELCIDDMLDDGKGFGRYDGFAVFVSADSLPDEDNKYKSVVPGDRVRARIVKVKKTSVEAYAVEITDASRDRVAAMCPYFGRCGGCTLQELSYEAQKRLKTQQVRQKLERLGGLEAPRVNDIIGADKLQYYRNKAVFAVGPHGEVGFKKTKSHYVMDIDDCILQTDAAMVCADALRAFMRDNPAVQRGAAPITGLTVKTAFGTGEVMAVLETGEREENEKKKGRRRRGGKGSVSAREALDIPGLDVLAGMLDDAVYSLGEGSDEADPGLQYSLESIAVVYKNKCRIAAGKPTITEKVVTDDGRELLFEIGPQSFYQVNPEQMVKLYDKAAEYAGLRSGDGSGNGADGRKVLLDLYCGVGTIGIWLADIERHERGSGGNVFAQASDAAMESEDPDAIAKRNGLMVIGIESVKPAVIDANRNSVINGLVNTRYICGKAEEELPAMMGMAKLYKWNEVNERVEREPVMRIGHAGSNAGHEDEVIAEKADIAVLDPPRAGCGEALLAAVAAAQPDRIVYVSCDPGTLARDIKYLAAHGYEFVEATPIDNFPMTAHCEVTTLLKRL